MLGKLSMWGIKTQKQEMVQLERDINYRRIGLKVTRVPWLSSNGRIEFVPSRTHHPRTPSQQQPYSLFS